MKILAASIIAATAGAVLVMVASPITRISACGNAEQNFNRALMELRITTNNPVSVALWNCSIGR